MRAIGSQNRETLEEAETLLLKLSLRDNELALTLNKHGQFEVWQMHNHVSGYCLEILGVGYEFIKSISNEEAYELLKEVEL